MYRTLLLLFAVFFSLSAPADVITCQFTEPFFSIEIDTEAKTLKKTEPDWDNPDGGVRTSLLSSKVKIKKLKPMVQSEVAEFARYLVIGSAKESMVLTLNYKGSDGMSDFAYPYETSFEGYSGGCSSDKLARLSFYYQVQQ